MTYFEARVLGAGLRPAWWQIDDKLSVIMQRQYRLQTAAQFDYQKRLLLRGILYDCSKKKSRALLTNKQFRKGMGPVYVIQTGGTIDKAYPKSTGGYAFEICEPAARRILQRGNVSPASCDVRVQECIRKDSQEITDHDRDTLWELCYHCHCADLASADPIVDSASRFIITHGTDTLVKTGIHLAGRLSADQVKMIIVLVGSKLPETFKDSDADFNLGVALGAVQSMGEDRTGVYIAMNGAVLPVHHASRNENDGSFFLLG